jgi:hypothetical protein
MTFMGVGAEGNRVGAVCVDTVDHPLEPRACADVYLV